MHAANTEFVSLVRLEMPTLDTPELAAALAVAISIFDCSDLTLQSPGPVSGSADSCGDSFRGPRVATMP
jgi:hypothetical protein